MPLSPYEMKALATIEEELRKEDPTLVAALSRTSSPPSSTFHPPLAIRHVLRLSGALIGLIAVHTVFGDRLGVVGLAVLTSVAVLPWLIATARSAQRRSRAAGGADRRPRSVGGNGRSSRGAGGPLRGGAAVLLAVVAVLTAAALMPPAWQPVVGFVLTFAVVGWLPRLLLRVVERSERRRSSSGSGRAPRDRGVGKSTGQKKM